MAKPLISVIIPTYNRAALLRSSLESLAGQSLPGDQYEVIVVDDGATDATREVCAELATRLDLKYFRIEHSGISAAKNLGIFAASGPIILFFDDDDYAAPTLLAEHLAAHARHPHERTAILGYTAWAPTLLITEVMHYVMDVGRLLFCYTMEQGQTLDFTHFWGGRTSCKRRFLAQHGVFRHELQSILEDIELGYRLSKHGLKVVFHRNAVQYMNRPITYDEFCRRCERQGQSQFLFGSMYPDDSVIEQYCQINVARKSWDQVREVMGMGYYRVRELESTLEFQSVDDDATREIRTDLHRLYKWTFNAFKMKGLMEAEEAIAKGDASTHANPPSPLVEPIVIYQMGKVGSKSVESSLRAYDLGSPICHSHLLNDLDRVAINARTSRVCPRQTLIEILHGKQVRKTILGSPFIRCRVISLVRDPVARNISAFFENIAEFVDNYHERFVTNRLPLDELSELFLNGYEHDIPLKWFEHQLKPVFGIDVFETEFARDRGYQIYHGQASSLLLLKLETLDQCAEAAFSEYLGIDQFVVKSTNVGENKEYRDLYRAFISSLILPETYLDRMYDSSVTRHFYTDDEIASFRSRWTAQSPALSLAGVR